MNLGIILFIVGLAVIFYLLKVHIQKSVLKNIGVGIAFLIALYGLILTVQPKEDEYVKFTKSTVSHKEKESNIIKTDR